MEGFVGDEMFEIVDQDTAKERLRSEEGLDYQLNALDYRLTSAFGRIIAIHCYDGLRFGDLRINHCSQTVEVWYE